MGKNVHGGSGHKKFANKYNNNNGPRNNKLRLSEDDGEIYAIVSKMLGNGMFFCHCIDGIDRLGHIRGKFSGRGKRDNIVEVGKWVLIGLREWDNVSTVLKQKKQQCDLLEIYLDTDKMRLRESVSIDWKVLDDNDLSKKEELNDSDIVFGSDRDFERERLLKEMKTSTMETITMKLENNNEDEVNVDTEINVEDI
jgi:translation initiation factor 1A